MIKYGDRDKLLGRIRKLWGMSWSKEEIRDE